MKNEIVSASNNELIDDYLIIDEVPLLGLGSEYLGRIVVEKSKLDLESAMDKSTSRKVNINGENAVRFELKTDSTKMIEYHLIKNGSTFRLIYNMSSSNEKNEAIFEKVANSFSFVK
jgi:hypothetical protein